MTFFVPTKTVDGETVGVLGAEGPTGPQGETGATGATGPPGTGGGVDLNVVDFGAVGDGDTAGGGTDNTAFVQDAIDTALARTPNPGGTIYFPPGIYTFDGELDVRGGAGIRFVGAGSSTYLPQVAYWGPTALVFTGNSGSGISARLIDCRNTFSVSWEQMSIVYINASYTGLVIDYQHDSASDSQNCLVTGCLIGGYLAYGSQGLINFRHAIFCKVEDCRFDNAEVGITGRYNPTPGSINYSNVVQIRDNVFNGVKYCIQNPGENWTVESNAFEGLQGSRPSGQYCHLAFGDRMAETTGYSAGGAFRDNWCGDAFGLTQWSHWGNASGGFLIEGNLFSGGVGGVFSESPNAPAYPTIRNNAIGVSSSPEVQSVSITATGGTFTLTFSGQTTTPIAYNASAGTVELALEALSNIGTDVLVTGSAGAWSVEFWDQINTNVALMTGNGSSLTGGSTTVTVATTSDFFRSYGIDLHGTSGGYSQNYGVISHNTITATNGDAYISPDDQDHLSLWGNSGITDDFTLRGHISSERGSPTPAVTIEAAAGVGAAVDAIRIGDTAGQIGLTPAGTPTSGKLLTITYGTAYRANFTGAAGVANRTIVLISPASAKAGQNTPGFYAAGTRTVWELWANAAPTAGQTYTFNYWVVQT